MLVNCARGLVRTYFPSGNIPTNHDYFMDLTLGRRMLQPLHFPSRSTGCRFVSGKSLFSNKQLSQSIFNSHLISLSFSLYELGFNFHFVLFSTYEFLNIFVVNLGIRRVSEYATTFEAFRCSPTYLIILFYCCFEAFEMAFPFLNNYYLFPRHLYMCFQSPGLSSIAHSQNKIINFISRTFDFIL